ncbi:PadR family transcriptional regulator [Faecalimonas sp.]
MDTKSNFRRGSVELLILHLLQEKDYYGYELSQNIKSRSNGIIDIPVGSLYPALYKLIDNGYITDYKQQAGKRLIRVYYHLESEGKKRLNLLLEDYYATNTGIQSILTYNLKKEEDSL